MIQLSEREKFIVLVSNDRLKVSDAIILLEGDGFSRVKKAIELFHNNWAPCIILSGGIVNHSYGSYHVRDLYPLLISGNIPGSSVIIEEKSQNTREQAIEIIALAKENHWKRLILVASHYHQFRAYLTFLKVMFDNGSDVEIINAPSNQLDWFNDEGWGKRYDLLVKEFEKIDEYIKSGHISTFVEAIEYQLWKERQK